jgi:hypothetical protein
MPIADAKAAMARAYASGKRPQFLRVAPTGTDEMWRLGDVLFVMPTVPADAPPLLEYALRLRREAMLTGTCDQCGASFDGEIYSVGSDAAVSDSFFRHRDNCPATDEYILPLMEQHQKARESATFDVEVRRVMDDIKTRVQGTLPNHIDVEVTDDVKDKANRLLDQRLTGASSCDHLKSYPMQPWNLLLWDDTWRCKECFARFGESIKQGAFRLDPVEDHSCDFCHRYCPSTWTPLVMRVDIFLMQGVICRRCALAWGYASEEGDK